MDEKEQCEICGAWFEELFSCFMCGAMYCEGCEGNSVNLCIRCEEE